MEVETIESINHVQPYVPWKPVEEVQREYGLDDVVKLASNENPKFITALKEAVWGMKA